MSYERKRLRITLRGAIQGVGFRPFIYRLAGELGLLGWVRNTAAGVEIEAEGAAEKLEQMLVRIGREKPPLSIITGMEPSWLEASGFTRFEIRESEAAASKSALILPDIATCEQCRREVFDPADRRYFYPFTNCTHCGPRFSIIEGLPYDRANTSMKEFRMCAACEAEYQEPLNRRFHAQPNACPDCGPQIEFWDNGGNVAARGRAIDVLQAAVAALRSGGIIAVKGVGGFHLMVAAHDERAVARLRRLKHREEKPLALMVPSLDFARRLCYTGPLEERLLSSPEAPIVLLKSRKEMRGLSERLAKSVAPGNPNLGLMLPYSPLHHLLLCLVNSSVVATSGNLSDEPICIDEHEAVARLGGIADFFLVHNRRIVRHLDDSIVRVLLGRELMIRRGRGYSPLPIRLPVADSAGTQGPVILSAGAHLKNTVALTIDRESFVSQHIGDLESVEAFEAFRRVIADLEQLYAVQPSVVVADAHPDYVSTRYARELSERAGNTGGVRFVSIQHHMAHVFSCMAENEIEAPALGVAWDGTGYGLDGTIWGGEFFLVSKESCERFAHFKTFPLVGGEEAIRDSRRTALGLLFETYPEQLGEFQELSLIASLEETQFRNWVQMLKRGLNSPRTSSVGRLFDGIAALIGVAGAIRFEGQAAMALEFALDQVEIEDGYPFQLKFPSSSPVIIDWGPILSAVMGELRSGSSPAIMSAKFHNGLVESLIGVARHAGQKRVLLSGGCFQNRYLLERAVLRLQAEGFQAYWHQRVPSNDGGISLGQAVAALRT